MGSETKPEDHYDQLKSRNVKCILVAPYFTETREVFCDRLIPILWPSIIMIVTFYRFMIGQYVTVHGDVISHLNISQAQVQDGGLYGCEAKNR